MSKPYITSFRFFLTASLLVLLVLESHALNYYWVGGSGDWSQYTTHWATSSGGSTFQVQVPQSGDVVHFDQNSFTGPGQTVTITQQASCGDMTWAGSCNTYTGSVNGPTFAMTNPLLVFGSLTLETGMRSPAINSILYFQATSTGKTITTHNVTLASSWEGGVSFNSPSGGWSFQDSFVITAGGIWLQGGSLNTNNQYVEAGFFRSSGVGVSRTLTMGSSTIEVNFISAYSNVIVFADAGLTMNPGTSTFIATYNPAYASTAYQYGIYFNGATFNRFINSTKFLDMSSTNSTFRSFISKGETTFEWDANTFTDSLYVEKGRVVTLNGGGNYYIGASGNLFSDGSCAGMGYIHSNNASTLANINKTGGWGSTTASNLSLYNINCTGGGTLTAANSINEGGNSNVNFTSPPASKSLYWVGGTGKWNDGNHWSLSSGGAASGCVPSPVDNVYFNGSSFSGAGQTVTVDSSSAYCNNMDWTGATNSPAFQTNQSESRSWSWLTLNVYGSIKFIAAMSTSFYGVAHFRSTGAATITSAGQDFDQNVSFDGTGTYSLTDNFVVSGGGDTYPATGILYFNQGTLNTNNFNITTRHFQSNNNNNRTLNFGSSHILINAMGTLANWVTQGLNLTVNAGTSVIDINNVTSNMQTNFYGGNNSFNIINFDNTEIAPQIQDFTANSLYFYGSGVITNYNTITNLLYLTGGKTYTFDAGKTTSFSAGATCTTNIGCNGLVIIKSATVGTQATFSKPSGTLTINGTTLQDIKATGGATFNATVSVDLGNNTGWSFTAATARVLYWVGGTGDWNDANHWALTSGGAGGNCAPTQLDDVYFDGLSFSAGGQIVSVSNSSIACKNMNWKGWLSGNPATHSPTFTMPSTSIISVFGSMTLISGMTWTVAGQISLKGTGSQTLTSGGQDLSTLGYIGLYVDCNPGTYTLADKLTVDYFHLESGNFKLNGNSMHVVGTGLWDYTFYTRSFDISNSYLTVDWFMDARVAFNMISTNSIVNYTSYSGGISTTGNTFDKVYFTCTTASGTNNYFNGSGAQNTLNTFRAWSSAGFYGTNTIKDSMEVGSGTYTFQAGDTTYFNNYATLSFVGTQTLPVFLQSTSAGSQHHWVMKKGRVCANHIWIKDSDPSGGATWQGGTDADNQSGNTVGGTGWDFITPYGIAGNGALSGGGAMCTGTSVSLNIHYSAFNPSNITKNTIIQIWNGTVNTYDTLTILNDTTLLFTPSVTTTYTLLKVTANECYSGTSTASGSGTATIKSGTAGVWDGSSSNDWFNCFNWADGRVPVSTTNVVIPTGLSTYPTIGAGSAVCNNITVQNAASLTINNSGSSLTVSGNFSLSGSLSHSAGTVTLNGSATNNLNGTTDYTFYNLTLNNSNGAIMNRSVTITGVLNLNSGALSINNNTLVLNGTVTGSGTLTGSSTATFDIGGNGALGTLYFTGGAQIVGNMVLNRGTSGTVTLGTPLTINTNLTFSNGNIISTTTNYLGFGNGATYSGVSDNSYVSGAVKKTGNTAFTFPVGKGGHYEWAAISAPSVNTDSYIAEYFNADPSVAYGSNRVTTLPFLDQACYWIVDKVSGSSSVTLTLSWNTFNGGSNITTPSQLRVAHWSYGSLIWNDEGNGGTAGGTSTGSIVTAGALSSFSPFTIASHTSANPLPIELLNFTAVKNGTKVDLNWSTATETNNNFFTVERSQDASSFEELFEKTGAGTTTLKHFYNGFDYNPLQGLSYYRLKQTDYDGKFSYSSVVPVRFEQSFGELTVYPNPVHPTGDNINLNLSGLDKNISVLVLLRDVLGKEYYSKVLLTDTSGDAIFTIESSESLARGVYFISASSNDHLITKKIVIE